MHYLSSKVLIKLFNGIRHVDLGTIKFFVGPKIAFNCLLQMVEIMNKLGDTFVELVIEFRLLFKFLVKASLQVQFSYRANVKVLVKAISYFVERLI